MQGVDYVATSDYLVVRRGDTQWCHRVDIIDDETCEPAPENFFANMLLASDCRSDIFINPNLTQVLFGKEQCGRLIRAYNIPFIIEDSVADYCLHHTFHLLLHCT